MFRMFRQVEANKVKVHASFSWLGQTLVPFQDICWPNWLFQMDLLLNLKSASNLNGNLNCSKELEHYAS